MCTRILDRTYQIRHGKKILQSADTLADVRSMARALFRENPEYEHLQIFAWHMAKDDTGGYSHVFDSTAIVYGPGGIIDQELDAQLAA